MAPTLEDLMQFLQQEKKDRAVEREGDMKLIKELISTGIRAEVAAAVEPLYERQAEVENTQKDMQTQLALAMTEIKNIKNQLNTQQNFPPLPAREDMQANAGDSKGDADLDRVPRGIGTLATEARKIIGLQTIYPADVERQIRLYNAKDEDEGRLLAVKEFLRLEMKIKEDVFNTMDIVRIFPPAKEEWDRLYVQFSSQTSVNTIYSYAKYLQKDQRLVTYIPHQFYDRYRALESLAYTLRHSELKYKTRVKMGSSDLILYKKKPGESTWSVIPTPHDLPPVNMNAAPAQPTSTPPPGRDRTVTQDQDRELRPRFEDSSDSPATPTKSPKLNSASCKKNSQI